MKWAKRRKTCAFDFEASCPFKACTPSLEKRPHLQTDARISTGVLMFLCVFLMHMNVHIAYKYWHLQQRGNGSESVWAVQSICVHVCLPCVSSACCLSVDLSSACWNLFHFGHSLHFTANVAPETCQERRFPFYQKHVGLSRKKKKPPDRLTYVVNVHPDSQLSSLKGGWPPP